MSKHCAGCSGWVSTYSGQGEGYECDGLDAAREGQGLDDMTAALEATMPGAAPKGGRWYREQAAAILARLAEAQQREGARE